jgi:hypothetical protein
MGRRSLGKLAGVGGIEEATRDLLTAWEGIRFEVDGDHEVDAERVLVLTGIPRVVKRVAWKSAIWEGKARTSTARSPTSASLRGPTPRICSRFCIAGQSGRRDGGRRRARKRRAAVLPA